MTAYREVERTVEFEPIDGWVYRITEFDDGAIVKRTAASERPVWSHGVLVQIYQPAADEFVRASNSVNPWLPSFADALAIVERQAARQS